MPNSAANVNALSQKSKTLPAVPKPKIPAAARSTLQSKTQNFAKNLPKSGAAKSSLASARASIHGTASANYASSSSSRGLSAQATAINAMQRKEISAATSSTTNKPSVATAKTVAASTPQKPTRPPATIVKPEKQTFRDPVDDPLSRFLQNICVITTISKTSYNLAGLDDFDDEEEEPNEDDSDSDSVVFSDVSADSFDSLSDSLSGEDEEDEADRVINISHDSNSSDLGKLLFIESYEFCMSFLNCLSY